MTKIIVNDAYILQRSGKEIMLFSAEKSELYSLNETAAFIFEKLRKGLGKEEIKTQLLNLYEADDKEIEEDITNILTFFFEKNIIYIESK